MRRTRYRARWLLPIAAPPIRDGALLTDEEGRIAEVGPDAAVAQPEDAERVDLGDAALLPGLVNAHAHPELAGLRGVLEDLPFLDWITNLRRIKLHAPLDADALHASALWQLAEAYAAGITTIGATEDSNASLDALTESGGRGVVYREVFGPAPVQCAHAMDELRERVDAMRARAGAHVRVGISPHAPYTVSDELFRAAAAYAGTEALPVAVHIAESAAESDLVAHGAGAFAAGLQRRGIATPARARSPIELLARTGVLALRPLLIHAVRVDADDIARIAAAGAAIAHCPVANARLGHGIAPVTAMLAAGVTVALGSDSVASNNRMDLLEEARIAQLMQRAQRHAWNTLDAAALLRMATLDGARALGLDDVTGSLERGKSADLTAVSLATLHGQPVHDVTATLVHAARGTDVLLTVVQGRVLYRHGTHPTIDVARVRERLHEIAARVAAARAACP